MADYRSPYFDPYTDYSQQPFALDAQLAQQQPQQGGGFGASLGNLGGMAAGQYAGSSLAGEGVGSIGGLSSSGLGAAATTIAPLAVGAYLADRGYSNFNKAAGKSPGAALTDMAKKKSNWIMLTNPATAGVPILGTLAGAFLGHESTKAAQKRRWGALSEPAQQLFQANHPDGDTGVWKDGKYAGQKWSFDKALDLAKSDPTHFQGVYGNLSALGDDGSKYLGLSDKAQKDFVAKNIAAGNYASKKGDVILQDHAKAQEIYNALDEVLAKNKKISELDNVKKI